MKDYISDDTLILESTAILSNKRNFRFFIEFKLKKLALNMDFSLKELVQVRMIKESLRSI